jgi:hypothetical protein
MDRHLQQSATHNVIDQHSAREFDESVTLLSTEDCYLE